MQALLLIRSHSREGQMGFLKGTGCKEDAQAWEERKGELSEMKAGGRINTMREQGGD